MAVPTLEEELASNYYFISFRSGHESYLRGREDLSRFISLQKGTLNLKIISSFVLLRKELAVLKIVTYEGQTYTLVPKPYPSSNYHCFFSLEPF